MISLKQALKPPKWAADNHDIGARSHEIDGFIDGLSPEKARLPPHHIDIQDAEPARVRYRRFDCGDPLLP